MQAIEWHRRLREGGESVEDGKHFGRPQTSYTAETAKRFLRWYIEVKDMAKNEFLKSFDGLYKPLQKCVATQRSYFEGGHVSEV
ncbi:hypothetical protein TNCV_2550161 [Trichonephila clavipes]|nr:hypothetical protein TNCV_2550161 [Trichonephila clavipes]